jgi:CheY-like chemotaxis protein
MTRAKILVVEDEFIIAQALQASLTEMGYDVVRLLATGEQAVEYAGDLRPDVVLMDIQLKGEMDGIQAAQRIQNSLHIPVVYLTAHSDPDTLKRVIHSKSYGYLVKPITEDALKEAIDKALSRHRGTIGDDTSSPL